MSATSSAASTRVEGDPSTAPSPVGAPVTVAASAALGAPALVAAQAVVDAPVTAGAPTARGSAGVPPARLGPPASGRLLVGSDRSFRPSPWPRLAVILVMLLPAIALATFGRAPSALWIAGLWGSLVCCGGTDSGWRRLNRLLVACAIAWLLLPLLLAT